MPRRSVFDNINLNEPVEPVVMIPSAKNRRTRTWEKNNRSRSYFIPRPLAEMALQIRDEIVGISDGIRETDILAPLATANDVAMALMERALHMVDTELIQIIPRFDPMHQRTKLICVDVEDEILPRRIMERREKPAEIRKEIYLAYRWPQEFDRRIKHIAKNNHIAVGEVVVLLLGKALEVYKLGRLKLIPQPITVKQTVTGVLK